ncbi:hypothetical protein KM043_011086 [Ampulex compressa]|nr:hypothetical protein KM043_011086 [Ampulex compressa]
MGEVCSILVPIEDWLRNLGRRSSEVLDPETKISIESRTNERRPKGGGSLPDLFLVDEPVLRDLFLGIPSDHDVLDVLCTINRVHLWAHYYSALGRA